MSHFFYYNYIPWNIGYVLIQKKYLLFIRYSNLTGQFIFDLTTLPCDNSGFPGGDSQGSWVEAKWSEIESRI